MPSAGASRLAGLIEWVNGLPAWGHGRHTAAEWQTWADEQLSEGGDRLWHYLTAARVVQPPNSLRLGTRQLSWQPGTPFPWFSIGAGRGS